MMAQSKISAVRQYDFTDQRDIVQDVFRRIGVLN